MGMAEPVDTEKVRKILKKITDEKIEPADFEDILATLTGSELLLLRELAVKARCDAIAALAQHGWPMRGAKPN